MQSVRRRDAAALVALGGGAGTLLRWWAGESWSVAVGSIPWPTLVVNVAASFIVGAVLTSGRPRAMLLLAVGFGGGLSTYSTLAVEIVTRLRADDAGVAVAYAVVTVLAGVVAAGAGALVGARWRAAGVAA